MARLLIVSDSKPMAFLLEETLRGHYRIEIIGRASSVEEAVRITGEKVPDLVLIASGVAMQEDVVPLAEQVYRANQNAVVIVTAASLPEDMRSKLLDACAIPLASDISDLPNALAELIPDLREQDSE